MFPRWELPSSSARRAVLLGTKGRLGDHDSLSQQARQPIAEETLKNRPDPSQIHNSQFFFRTPALRLARGVLIFINIYLNI